MAEALTSPRAALDDEPVRVLIQYPSPPPLDHIELKPKGCRRMYLTRGYASPLSHPCHHPYAVEHILNQNPVQNMGAALLHRHLCHIRIQDSLSGAGVQAHRDARAPTRVTKSRE